MAGWAGLGGTSLAGAAPDFGRRGGVMVSTVAAMSQLLQGWGTDGGGSDGEVTAAVISVHPLARSPYVMQYAFKSTQ